MKDIIGSRRPCTRGSCPSYRGFGSWLWGLIGYLHTHRRFDHAASPLPHVQHGKWGEVPTDGQIIEHSGQLSVGPHELKLGYQDNSRSETLPFYPLCHHTATGTAPIMAALGQGTASQSSDATGALKMARLIAPSWEHAILWRFCSTSQSLQEKRSGTWSKRIKGEPSQFEKRKNHLCSCHQRLCLTLDLRLYVTVRTPGAFVTLSVTSP